MNHDIGAEDRFDEELRDAARAYNAPPPDPPREEMWRAIQAARRRGRPSNGGRAPRDWTRWGIGIAAVLALGIALGRVSIQPTAPSVADGPRLETGPPIAGDGVFRLAATEHLGRAEALLVAFQAQARQDDAAEPDAQVAGWARDLLSTTRLLLDSPAAEDPQLASLLEDLELVLAQIVQLPADGSRGERELIEQGIQQRGVLTKLRSAVPAGPATFGS